MAQDVNEATRVMPSGGAAPVDRTMISGAGAAGATQMGGSVACAVCQTSSPSMETYCVECGFLLASTPGIVEEPLGGPAIEDAGDFALVESSTGRRFVLRTGMNTVGRENADILLMDS